MIAIGGMVVQVGAGFRLRPAVIDGLVEPLQKYCDRAW